MATYNVTDQTSARRVQFTGNGTAGPFAFAFQVNATSEVKVFVDTTEKTETTHYTVSLNSSTGAGTISFTTGNHPTSSETITIMGDIPLSRTSVYTSGGQFTASSLEDDFDTNMFIHQQTNEEINRSLRQAEHDVISGADMTLPVKDTRKGTVLGFNATTGNPEAGPNITAVQSLADVTTAINLLGTSDVVTDMGLLGTSANVTAMGLLGTSSNVTAMGLLGTSAVVADMALLGTSDVVADMALLADTDVIADMNTLATSDIISDLNTLATSDIVTDMNLLATSDNVTAMGILGTSSNVTAMGLLGTSAVVEDMGFLGTSANVTAMGILGTSANVTAMGLLGTSDVVTDLGILATSANVTAMGILGTSSNVTAMGLLGTSDVVADLALLGTSDVVADLAILATSANVTNMATLGASGVVGNIATVAGISSNVTTVANNVSGVNSFAERYRVGSSDPSSNNDEGDLFYNTSDNTFKFFNGSSFVAVNVTGIDNIVEDTTPQLGGNLDVNGNSIVSVSGGNISITPDGSGKVIIDGLSHPTSDGSNGQFLKTDGGGNLSFATVTGTTINNNADNRIITGSGSANTLEAEANLTFDGTNLDLGDSKKIRLGASQDLEIFHDGSNSIIKDNGTGSLIMRGSTAVFIQGVNEEIFFEGNENGQVKLYNDNNVKLTTTSGGVTVTGTISATTGSFSNGDISVTGTGNRNISVLSDDGLGTIEVGGATGGFIDIKAPKTDDFDLRLGASGTGGYLTLASGSFTVSGGVVNSVSGFQRNGTILPFQSTPTEASTASSISIGTSYTTVISQAITHASSDRIIVLAQCHLDTQSSSTSGQGDLRILATNTSQSAEIMVNQVLAESARLRWNYTTTLRDSRGISATTTYHIQVRKTNGSMTANGGGGASKIILIREIV